MLLSWTKLLAAYGIMHTFPIPTQLLLIHFSSQHIAKTFKSVIIVNCMYAALNDRITSNRPLLLK